MRLDLHDLRARIVARGCRVVAIDGFGGAGKSTLARLLADGWDTAVVVAMDDFYRPVAERPSALAGDGANWDRERLVREVLAPLRAGCSGRYARYDWDADAPAEVHDVPADATLLLEGIHATSAPLRGYADYRIWVDAPYATRLARGVARDGEAMRRTWVEGWMPGEAAYAAAERPSEHADLMVDGGGDGEVTFAVRDGSAG